MAGCTCHSWWTGCDGVMFDGNKCVVYNGWGGEYATLHANCISTSIQLTNEETVSVTDDILDEVPTIWTE